MNERLLPYTICKSLRDSGFNDPCDYFYDEQQKVKWFGNLVDFYKKNSSIKYSRSILYLFTRRYKNMCTAMSFNVVNDWMLKNHGIYCEVTASEDGNGWLSTISIMDGDALVQKLENTRCPNRNLAEEISVLLAIKNIGING